MDTSGKLEFTLKGKVEGVEITPSTIGLYSFNRFNHDVEEFITGSERGQADNIRVSIESGSYKIVAFIPAVLLVTLNRDLRFMERPDSLQNMDQRRANIVRRWQSQARKGGDLTVTIAPGDQSLKPVVISRSTDFHAPDQNEWVKMEEYVLGTITDMGGAAKANIHLKLADGRTIIAASSEEYLRNQNQNFLYHKAQVRISAEKNVRTKGLRNERLIAIIGEGPSYDPKEIENLIAKGTAAWADVSDAVGWVREQRGGA